MTSWIRGPEHERWHASRVNEFDMPSSVCGLPLDEADVIAWQSRHDPPGRDRCLECNDLVAPRQRRKRRSQVIHLGPLEVALRRYAAG